MGHKEEFFKIKQGMRNLNPLSTFEISGKTEDYDEGKKLIEEGKVAALILAGGSGSRLGFEGPKGAFIFPDLKISLFQIFFEKIKKASLAYKRGLYFAIMTSTQNNESTIKFLEQNSYFGIDKELITIFIQNSLPYLNDEGNEIWQDGTILEGPSGNGEALALLYKSPAFKKWEKEGIEQVLILPIDNPLADPFDPILCGFHNRKKDEITLKCVKKLDPDENVGLVVESEGKIKIVEYTEFSKNEKNAVNAEGFLKFSIANCSLFSFDLQFIKKCSSYDLPFHFVKKKIGKELFAWKGEHHIFDLLECALQVSVIVYPREEIFSPLKTPGDIPLVEKRVKERSLKII